MYGTYGDHILKLSPDPSVSFNNDPGKTDNELSIIRKIRFESYPEIRHWPTFVFRLDADISKNSFGYIN